MIFYLQKTTGRSCLVELLIDLLLACKDPQHVKVIMLMPEKEETPSSVPQQTLKERLLVIGQRCAALPVVNQRTPDEILGYDNSGMPPA